MQRKDEILAKKAKLAELRRQREEREQRQKELSRRDSAIGTPDVISPAPARSNDPQEIEKILKELIPERPSVDASPKPRDSHQHSILDHGKSNKEQVVGESGSPSGKLQFQTTSVATQTSLSTIPITTNYEFTPAPPKEIVSYNKSIQTSDSWSSPRSHRFLGESFSDSNSDNSPSVPASRATKRLSRRERQKEDELRQKLRQEIEEELKTPHDLAPSGPSTETTPNLVPRILTDEEQNAVTSSGDFLEFVERSSKVVERALDQDYDVLVDYGLDGLEGIEDDDGNDGYGNSSRGKKGRRIREVAQFYDERWSKKRMISDLGFSPKFPELLLTSYTKNPSAPQDPSGLLQIWNMHLRSRPEYTFHSNSDILTAKFSPFHPSLLLGGSYSGQVLLWDTRSKSPLPVQKTPLTGTSTGGHTHPVYSISLVGTQNANNIISCSTDGVVCGWTVDMLSQPQEYLELTTPPPSKTEDLSPTCMAFPAADPTSFLVGTEEGTIFPCHRYDRAGAKAGVDPRVRYKGHTAPIMGLNFHPVRGPVDLGDLLLSSSLDWTVKLWKIRPPSSASVVTTTSAPGTTPEQAFTPLLEFSREEVVYDARWSPHRPGVFALVDSAGQVEVWDLTVDTEIPITSATPEPNHVVAAQSMYSPKSLNKVVWEEKEGKRLAVGGAGGIVTVFEVGSDLGAEGVRTEEWAGMKRLVGRAEAGQRP